MNPCGLLLRDVECWRTPVRTWLPGNCTYMWLPGGTTLEVCGSVSPLLLPLLLPLRFLKSTFLHWKITVSKQITIGSFCYRFRYRRCYRDFEIPIYADTFFPSKFTSLYLNSHMRLKTFPPFPDPYHILFLNPPAILRMHFTLHPTPFWYDPSYFIYLLLTPHTLLTYYIPFPYSSVPSLSTPCIRFPSQNVSSLSSIYMS